MPLKLVAFVTFHLDRSELKLVQPCNMRAKLVAFATFHWDKSSWKCRALRFRQRSNTLVKSSTRVNNLLSLADYKRAGGSVQGRPTILEQRAFIDAARSLQMSRFHQSLLTAPSPQDLPPLPDNKVQNGSKLGLAIPSFDGDRERWFNWKEMVEIKIAQFPSFGKAFTDEAEAVRDTVTSTVLYNIFLERTYGGAAQTLVQSATPKTGYHAFKALTDAMEGKETVDRIREEAKKLEELAQKDSEKTILEFRGDCQKYFTVADRVEKFEGRTALSDDKKMKHILHSVTDSTFKETMIRLKEKVDAKTVTTTEELFSLLSATETYLATSPFDKSAPSPSIRRTQGQQSPGPTNKKVKFDEGGSLNTKLSEITLPSGLYEAMTPELQVWANDWARTLKKSGDPKAAAKVPKPSEESVEKHKKRRASAMAGRDNDNSDNGGSRKKKGTDGKTQKSNVSGPQSKRYPPSIPSPSDTIAPPPTIGGPLSIGKLGGGSASVPPNDKDFPVLRVILFKEPKGIMIPISSSSPTRRPQGALAISPSRATNPKEADIDPNSRDYSFVESPKTVLSMVSSRQVQLSRLVTARK
jgi:hypothetical protein